MQLAERDIDATESVALWRPYPEDEVVCIDMTHTETVQTR